MNMEMKLSLNNITGHVLVVDDEIFNRELLEDLLDNEGHKVSLAGDGAAALKQCDRTSFDVILLDVMMPKIDGFDVCRRLKSNRHTAFIPVLLVTALNNRQDRLKGIQAGANDFITKPIDGQDVKLRVRNAIYTKKMYDQLHEEHLRLLESESLREDLSNMIVHDMRTPLSVISLSIQLITRQELKSTDPAFVTIIDRINSSCRNLTDMANLILDSRRLEEDKMPLNKEKHNLDIILNEVTAMLEPMAANIGSLTASLEGNENIVVDCDADLIRRVIINLAVNAIKVVAKKSGTVAIKARLDGAEVRIFIVDNGPGIPPEFQEKIFTKFGQVEAKRQSEFHSSGLGLTFCKLVVEAHGGRIGVESAVGQGSTFWFTLRP